MNQPPGFEKGNYACKLRKSLYGLKQAARAWNKIYHEAVISFGFKQSEVDKCLYSMKKGNDPCYMIVKDMVSVQRLQTRTHFRK